VQGVNEASVAEMQTKREEKNFTAENAKRADPLPNIRNISRKACPEHSRKDAKAAKKIVIRTWRSSRPGGRNLRVREVLCGHKIYAWRANLEATDFDFWIWDLSVLFLSDFELRISDFDSVAQ
jgi:hypothetical protein